MTDKLVEYCNENILNYVFSISEYWPSELYSLGVYTRIYGFYPMLLPLCVYSDHGVTLIDKPSKHELDSDAPCQLYHSPRLVKAWKDVSKKPCYVRFSPFVFYRRKNSIEKDKNATGTIAFPAHSTPSIEDVSNINKYIDELLSLPVEFHPVSICLHNHDINKGRHIIYLNRGMTVFTAGNGMDSRFAERFYNILKKFKYSTSNLVGSYAYYSVEMGIPFSIYGEKQKFINNADDNLDYGEYDPYKLFSSYSLSYELFNKLSTSITKEQKDAVEFELGLRDGISRVKMASVLYSSFLKWIFSKRSINFFSRKLKK